MIALTLTRDVRTAKCTLGIITLTADGSVVVPTTLELPWRNNQPDVSCIPAGTYLCQLLWSPVHRRTLYWVTGVENRKDVELHIGNFITDTDGCILLGSTRSGNVIEGSRIAFDAFMEYLNGAPEFTLNILEP